MSSVKDHEREKGVRDTAIAIIPFISLTIHKFPQRKVTIEVVKYIIGINSIGGNAGYLGI
jgi:hypothetical protein